MSEEGLIISKIFSDTANRFPQKIALQIKKNNQCHKFTYRDVDENSKKVANFLIKEGFKDAGFITIILENRPRWPIIYLGIIYAGLTCLPIDPELSIEQFKWIITESNTKVIFCSYRIFLEKIKKIKQLFNKIVVLDAPTIKDGDFINFSVIESFQEKFILPTVLSEDIASLIYTSGTEASPKGVMLTHKNLCSNFLSIKKLNLIKTDDNVISILPLHHSYPFMVTLLAPLFFGAKITYIDTLKPEEILKSLREEKITIFVVVPQILNLFYKAISEKLKSMPLFLKSLLNLITEISWIIRKFSKLNLSKIIFSKIHSYLGRDLRFIVCGGAKLDEKVTKFFFKLGFNIIEGYGLTEASPVVSFNPPNKPKFGSVGKTIPDVNVKIQDPDNEGRGQILIKGPNIMKGYYKREQETKSALKDGWLYTGDLGILDRQGYLYIKGREKEIIVLSSGKNISPEEIEKHYLRSPCIKEMCIFTDLRHERIVAVVVPNLEYFRKIEESSIYDKIKWDLQYFSEKLPSYKRIMGFVLINKELPKTRLGKTQRFKVSQIYRDEIEKKSIQKGFQIEEDISLTARKILQILKDFRNQKIISLDDHLELDLGIDSLARVEIMVAIEKAFNIQIKEEDFYKIFTVGELIRNIESLIFSRIKFYEREDVSWNNILASMPSGLLMERIDLKVGLKQKIFTFLGASFLFVLFKLFFMLRVYGRQNLSEEEFILCANHTSYLDGFLIYSSCPINIKYNLFFIGLSAYFEVPIIRNFLRYIKVIPVDSSKNLIEAMKASSFVLKNKKVLCIFPEGSRSIDGQLKEFKKGVGILAKELDIKIVPVYINGAYRAWKPTSFFPKPFPIRIIFGRPLLFSELKNEGLNIDKDADDYQAISLGIKQEILKLKAKLGQI